MYYLEFVDGPVKGQVERTVNAPRFLRVKTKDGKTTLYKKVKMKVGGREFPTCVYRVYKNMAK